MNEFDYIILGAGPGGLQMGYFLERAGRSYVILEADDSAGHFFKAFPRHRMLISINKIYTGYDDSEINMRWDWNSLLSDEHEILFKDYSESYFPQADELVAYLRDFAARFALKIRYNTRAVRISKPADRFIITDEAGATYTSRSLIVATGYTRPYIPPIPGIDLAELYTQVSVQPKSFANQRVLIIGKGNSAFETADNLIATAASIHLVSPHPLRMAWKTHYVGHLRAVNNNLLDTYQLKSQNAILDSHIEKIERADGAFAVSFHHIHAPDERETLIYDRVIACTGFRFDPSIFDATCRPELTINDRFPCQTSAWESTNVPGLYFAGALMHMRDFRKTTSGFIHGFRYNIRALHAILEQRLHGRELPYRLVDASPEQLADLVIKQVNASSTLWQQFGFLCDLIVVSEDGAPARYYEGLPVDYVHESPLGRNKHYYMVTLEYGHRDDGVDLFNADRVRKDDVDHADQSKFLHPIIRHFCESTLVAEHHIIEDFRSEWLEEEHRLPLLRFLQIQSEGATAGRMPDGFHDHKG